MRIGVASPFVPREIADMLDTPAPEQLHSAGFWPTHLSPLVRQLHGRGHRLVIFCLEPAAPRHYELQGDRIKIHVFPKRPNRKCLLDIYRVERRLLRQAILAERPEVISAQWTREHALAALETGLPTAVTCHDTPLRYTWVTKHPYMWYHLVLAWWVIRKADQLICVSPYTAQHIKRIFRPRGPVDIVPNGLPPEVFEHGKRRLAQGSAPQRTQYTFCSVGRWGPMKNIGTLLEAFARVRCKQPQTRLVLFGPGLGPGEGAEQWARMRGFDQSVEFRGNAPREKILDFLEAEADLMVHPSVVETHGMTIIEAMACGVPVIGGQNAGAVAWTLEEGRCGYLCDVRSADALAQTMHHAMIQPEANRALAERAFESVRTRFRIETVADAYETILDRLRGARAPHLDTR